MEFLQPILQALILAAVGYLGTQLRPIVKSLRDLPETESTVNEHHTAIGCLLEHDEPAIVQCRDRWRLWNRGGRTA